MTEIFISYSRRDKAFAERFTQALNQNGYPAEQIWVDWEDIPPVSEWEKEIKKGIEASNSIIFLLSPDWAASAECAKELRFAAEYNKRLFPIVCKNVDPKTIPAELGSLNWIFFRETDNFDEALKKLFDAINTDLGWVSQHTNLLRRANEWNTKDRDGGYLLRGSELQGAESWLAQASEGKQPHPTSLQGEYIVASRQDDVRRQRRNLIWVSTALVVSVALAIMAVISGISALRESQRALASQLAAEAISLVNTQPDLSLLLSLESNYIGDQLNESDAAWTGSLVTALNSSPRLGTFLRGHEQDVRALAFSPDGRWLATAGGIPIEKSGEVYLWDLQSAAPQSKRLEAGEIDRFLAIDFSTDSKTVVAAGDGKQLFLWRVEDCCQPAQQWNVTDKVRALKIVRVRGQNYVAAAIGNQVTFWDLQTGQQATELTLEHSSTNEKKRIMSLALSPDGNSLAAGTEDGFVVVWNVNDGQQRWRACTYGETLQPEDSSCNEDSLESKEIRGVGFNISSSLLVTGSFDKHARLWDAASGDALAITPGSDEGGHLNAVTGAVFRPAANMIATVSWDNTVKLWRVAETGGVKSFQRVDTLEGHANSIWAAAYSPDGSTLASVSSDKSVILWEVDQFSQIGTPLGKMEDSTWALAAAPSGKQVAAGDDSGNIRLWDLVDGKFLFAKRFEHPGGVLGLAYAHTHPWLASVGYDGVLRLWNLETGREAWNKEAHTDETWGVTFSPDDQYLATVSYDKSVKIWDVKTQALIATLQHADRVFALTYNTDGNELLVAGYESTIYRWDVKDPAAPQSLDPLIGHNYSVNSLAFNDKYPRLLASTSDDKTLRVWNVIQNESTPPVLGLIETMEAVAFRPSGDWVASATDNNTVVLWQLNPQLCNSAWDKNACQPRRIGDPLVGHDAPVQNVIFLTDEVLISSDNAGQLIYWNLKKSDWYQNACDIVKRNFAAAENTRYLQDKVNNTLLGAVAWVQINLFGAPAPDAAPDCLNLPIR